MPTQGERQNYLWRPNDNSSTTRLRYDLEAEHWLTSIKSATSNSSRSAGGEFVFIGLLFGLVVNLLFIVVLSLTSLFKWILGRYKSTPNGSTTTTITYGNGLPEKPLTPDEVDEIIRTTTPISIYEDRDNLFREAAEIVVIAQIGSASLLQRKLKLGYNRARRVIDQLEAAGILGGFDGNGNKYNPRQVLVTDLTALDQLLSNESL